MPNFFLSLVYNNFCTCCAMFMGCICVEVSKRARTSVINFSIYVILSLSSAITKSKTSRAIMCCHYKNLSTNTFAPTHRQVRRFSCKIDAFATKQNPQTENTRLILLMVTHSLPFGNLMFQIYLYIWSTDVFLFCFPSLA